MDFEGHHWVFGRGRSSAINGGHRSLNSGKWGKLVRRPVGTFFKGYVRAFEVFHDGWKVNEGELWL